MLHISIPSSSIWPSSKVEEKELREKRHSTAERERKKGGERGGEMPLIIPVESDLDSTLSPALPRLRYRKPQLPLLLRPSSSSSSSLSSSLSSRQRRRRLRCQWTAGDGLRKKEEKDQEGEENDAEIKEKNIRLNIPPHHRYPSSYPFPHPRSQARWIEAKLKQTTFGVPNHWTRYFDLLLWSLRGDAAAVHEQLQATCRFRPALSLEWVRLRLQETAFEQLVFLRAYLPGEKGTLQRVTIRATVLKGGHDFFHEGPAIDETPNPASTKHMDLPPLPKGGPEGWKNAWDVLVCEEAREGKLPGQVLRELRRMGSSELRGLTRLWLEVRMVQSAYLGLGCRF